MGSVESGIEYSDVVIVGGGASGLAAAVELRMSLPEFGVTVIEKNSETGRKLRATGSGRCNITNTRAEGYPDIMDFFTSIGLVTRTYDNGLVYPYSESAADAADLLESRARELGVRILTDAEVRACDVFRSNSRPSSLNFGEESSRSSGQVFSTSYALKGEKRDRAIRSRYLILACGGKAGPMFGTTGDGYRLAKELGHSIVTPVPALTSIECSEWGQNVRPDGISLAGTRTRGTVSLYRKAGNNVSAVAGASQGIGNTGLTEVFRETGEIQFTKYGLSGICVFNMTRHMRYDRSGGESIRDFLITADLFPDGDIRSYLESRRRAAFPGEKAASVLRTVLKENIAAYVIETSDALSVHPSDGLRHDPETSGMRLAERPVAELTDDEIGCIADAVHTLHFHPIMLKGWKEAQVTSGGVSTSEIDPDTCESAVTAGLFITGELADRDYMCGGFNLSNAWVTGMKAARTIAGRAI